MMRPTMLRAGLLGLALLFVAGATAAGARDSTASIKELMGDNFQHIQLILSNLITSQYGELPAKIKVIREHAEDLPGRIPDSVSNDFQRRTFISYAYRLESTAANMLTVLEALDKRDKPQDGSGELEIDYLRVVAAQHFGEIVTTCVLCHNQFRRHIVR